MCHQKPAATSTSERCENPLNWKRCSNRLLNCSSQEQRMILAQKKRSLPVIVNTFNRTILWSGSTAVLRKITKEGQASMDAWLLLAAIPMVSLSIWFRQTHERCDEVRERSEQAPLSVFF